MGMSQISKVKDMRMFRVGGDFFHFVIDGSFPPEVKAWQAQNSTNTGPN